MARAKNLKVIFEGREIVGGYRLDGRVFDARIRVLAQVSVNLDLLDALIIRAAKNKGKRATCGPIFVEVYKSQVLTEVSNAQ